MVDEYRMDRSDGRQYTKEEFLVLRWIEGGIGLEMILRRQETVSRCMNVGSSYCSYSVVDVSPTPVSTCLIPPCMNVYLLRSYSNLGERT